MKLSLVSRTHVCLGWEMSEPAFCSPHKLTGKNWHIGHKQFHLPSKSNILGYLRESSVAPCAQDFEILEAGYVSTVMAAIHNSDILKMTVLQIFMEVKLNKSNILYLASDLNPPSLFQLLGYKTHHWHSVAVSPCVKTVLFDPLNQSWEMERVSFSGNVQLLGESGCLNFTLLMVLYSLDLNKFKHSLEQA